MRFARNRNDVGFLGIGNVQSLGQRLNRIVAGAIARQGIQLAEHGRRRVGFRTRIAVAGIGIEDERGTQFVDDLLQNHAAVDQLEYGVEFILARVLHRDGLPGGGGRIERDALTAQADVELRLGPVINRGDGGVGCGRDHAKHHGRDGLQQITPNRRG